LAQTEEKNTVLMHKNRKQNFYIVTLISQNISLILALSESTFSGNDTRLFYSRRSFDFSLLPGLSFARIMFIESASPIGRNISSFRETGSAR
jgi:hypothetical protein